MPEHRDSHAADLQRVSGIADPAERFREVTVLLARCARATEALAEVRRNAVIEMHEGGMTHQAIADALGLSKPRVGQLAGSGWTHTTVAKRRHEPAPVSIVGVEIGITADPRHPPGTVSVVAPGKEVTQVRSFALAPEPEGCPHPRARILRGLCNACGNYVGS